jgi:4a-hydroxytetrahydrobiopterin dehydratase
MALAEQKCVPCQGGIPPLPRPQAERYLKETPGWSLDSTGTKISRKFTFPDFLKSLDFVNRVGGLAEEQGHHPDIAFGWGYAEIVFYTHKIKGLHENDFVMAAKVNGLA